MSQLRVKQLSQEGEGWWGLRFTGPSELFWGLVEQLRAQEASWDPLLFDGRGGWLLEEEKLLQYADRFTDLLELVQARRNEPAGVRESLELPASLRAECSLLHLSARASLAQVRRQYRELAKLYHPDAGGHQIYFLALQRAYERVAQYLQADERKSA